MGWALSEVKWNKGKGDKAVPLQLINGKIILLRTLDLDLEQCVQSSQSLLNNCSAAWETMGSCWCCYYYYSLDVSGLRQQLNGDGETDKNCE